MKEKIYVLKVILFLSVGLLVLRLIQLQVFLGNKYRQLAEGNRVQKVKIVGPRGIIFDRHGEILAKDTSVYKLKDGDKSTTISRDEGLKLQAENKDQNLFIDYVRDYPQGEVFSHAVGYLGQLSEAEVKSEKLKVKSYGISDLVGKAGIEQFYEDELRGKDGGELVEVDTTGKILRRIGRVEPMPGKNLTLAIDANLQKVAVAAFAKATAGRGKGAIIATNPQTGEVLILYSAPSYDPNYFVAKRSEEMVGEYLSDSQNLPLFNRVISGTYPPGSTFKIVTATAGLEEKKITANTLINDPGVIYVGSYKYSNWYFTGYGKTEGEINIVRAIRRSTDTFFYKLGEMVGVEKLVFWAKKFGLDKTFGLDLPSESAGFIPTPEWKERVKKEAWFLGNTYHMAIGQGDLALTPLGVNMMTSAVANGGKICQPRMLKATNDKDNPCQEIGIKKETIDLIKEGMIEACSSGGTAYSFFNFVPQVACKTGTAEYIENSETKTHAWFTVFAPSDNPSIVLTVLVEGGGEGSSVAAPIAKEILKEYFLTK